MLPGGMGMFSTSRAAFHALSAPPSSVLGQDSATLLLGLHEPKGMLATLQPVVFISTEGK